MSMQSLIALLLVTVPPAISAKFNNANDAYLRGDFATARREFEEVARERTQDAIVFYNLGNAHFREGRLGPATYAYERALALNPSGPVAEDIAFNLRIARAAANKLAREKLQGTDRPSWWEQLLTGLPPEPVVVVFLILWAAFFMGLILVKRMAGVTRATVVALTASFGITACLLGAWLTARAWYDETVVRGIVLPDRTEAREGPDPSHRATFPLHAGLRVRIMDHDSSWVRVRLSNGLEGWLPEQEIGRL
jgi:tetratricopeptide (TPR) repeat protein